MSMVDLVAIDVESPRIDFGCSCEKDFSELICMNPSMILYLTIDQVFFMSELCIWSSNLRHLRHLVDAWLYIDYDV